MNGLKFQNGIAHIAGVSTHDLVERYGTPLYVYSLDRLKEKVNLLQSAFHAPRNLVCFAVKSNSNLSVLREVFSLGCGADVVSIGELERSLLAGVETQKIMFSGVGKRDDEIKRAIELGLKSINIESMAEYERVEAIAKNLRVQARCAFRVNPNIDAQTHPKISTGMFSSKFGIIEDDVRDLILKAARSENIKLVGLSCHIGSQITSVSPYGDAAQRMSMLVNFAMEKGHQLEFVDMGGGYGIQYHKEELPEFEEYYKTIASHFPDHLQLVIEPGRSLVGDSGYLVTKSLYTKTTPEKNFIVVDAAMNDLMRPSLYDSYHEIVPAKESDLAPSVVEFVGPVCETGDILGESRYLPFERKGGTLYIIKDCGAYGATMVSNYNTRCHPAEVFVSDGKHRLINRRQELHEIWARDLDALEQTWENV